MLDVLTWSLWPSASFTASASTWLRLSALRVANRVAFHAKDLGDLAPLHPGRRPFAFSNPVFLE